MYYDTFLIYLFMVIVMLQWFTDKILYTEHLQLLKNNIKSYGFAISSFILVILCSIWVYIAFDYFQLLKVGTSL